MRLRRLLAGRHQERAAVALRASFRGVRRPASRVGLLGAWLTGLAVLLAPLAAPGLTIGPETSKYLLIGTGDSGMVGTAVAVSNFELGANQAPVPMPGLTLVEPIPPSTVPVLVGISGDGDVAVTDPNGTFNVSNVDIFATMGVQCAAPAVDCNAGASNSTFNGLPFPANGLMGDVDFTALLAELAGAKALIPGLMGDHQLEIDLSSDGKFAPDTVFNLLSGVTVIDIDTGGNDLLLENTNLVFDGPADAFAVVRVPDDANFNVSQSAILVGDSGIGLNNVLFYSDKPDTNAHFNFDSLLVNGVAFWDLAMTGSESVWNNVQGCTQAVGDKINLNDVRLTNCAFVAVVPESDRSPLLALGLLVLAAFLGWQRRSALLT